MKLIFIICLTIIFLPAYAQQKDSIVILSNSFENYYSKLNPKLKYSFDDISKIHNYSNNWDFDKDGIKDELYFVSTGGAHNYYYLKVILSKDHKKREFNFIESDFPILTAEDTANFNKTSFGFVVTRFGKNSVPTIIVKLDNQSFYENRELIKRKIKTRNIMISFKNGITKFEYL